MSHAQATEARWLFATENGAKVTSEKRHGLRGNRKPRSRSQACPLYALKTPACPAMGHAAENSRAPGVQVAAVCHPRAGNAQLVMQRATTGKRR